MLASKEKTSEIDMDIIISDGQHTFEKKNALLSLTFNFE
jgi:hypothetical protein